MQRRIAGEMFWCSQEEIGSRTQSGGFDCSSSVGRGGRQGMWVGNNEGQ